MTEQADGTARALPTADELRPKPVTKTDRKREAQDILMHGIATALGYWTEQHALLAEQMTPDEIAEFQKVLNHQADRLARVFGHDEAWSA